MTFTPKVYTALELNVNGSTGISYNNTKKEKKKEIKI